MDNFSELDLFDTLSELGLSYKNSSGNQLQLEKCPFCETDRPKPSDHFSFNRSEGVFNCVKCNHSGNLITFRRELGLDPFKSKIYKIPDQKKCKTYQEQPETYFKAYFEARGIPEPVLKKYGVGKTFYGDLGQCRTYQYVDTDGTIVNVKYVNKNKEMRQEKDAKKIYYGTQFLDFSKDYLHITEGEDDCHALVAMGYDNVVSVPSGAKMYSEEMGGINAKFKKLYLFFDNDKAGQEGAEKFAQKAGVWKCYNVLLPFKDCRDCYRHGIDIFDMSQIISKAKKFDYNPETKNRPALSIVERLDRFEKDAEKNHDGIKFDYEMIDDYTGGLRGGDVFSIVANPGCFKTTMLMNMIARAIVKSDTGIAIFFSLEMQIEAERERELQIYMQDREPWRLRTMAKNKTDEWKFIKDHIDNSKYNRIYVSEETGPTVDSMVEIIKKTEEVSGEKCIIVGIDYLDFINGKTSKEYDLVKEVMLSLKMKIARNLNIPVIILAQTGRDNKDQEEEVTLRSGKGGTAIEATSDFFIGIWKSGDRVVGRFAKHRRMIRARKENSYLSFEIDKAVYTIKNIIASEKPSKSSDNTNENIKQKENWF